MSASRGVWCGGEADWPFTRQYRGTPAYLYQIEQQVRWGMGWPLGLAAFAGLAWTIWRAARRKLSAGEVVMLAWVWPYFLINGAFMVKFMRYMVILTPFLCLLAAHLILALVQWLRGLKLDKLPRWSWLTESRRAVAGRWLAGALVVISLGWTVLYALGFETIYTRPTLLDRSLSLDLREHPGWLGHRGRALGRRDAEATSRAGHEQRGARGIGTSLCRCTRTTRPANTRTSRWHCSRPTT